MQYHKLSTDSSRCQLQLHVATT